MNKIWKLVTDNIDKDVKVTKELEKLRNTLIYEVTERLNKFNLNTTVSAFMEYTNKLGAYANANDGVDKETLETLVRLLAPFAPHISEELWEQLGHETTVFKTEWPVYDLSKMKDEQIKMPVQINGKVRATVVVDADADKDTVLTVAKEAIAARLEGKSIVKEIVVPKKIINIVVK